MLYQERDIIGALAQWRHAQNTYLQSVIEILTQVAGANRLLGITVGRRDQPHIHGYLSCGADWANASLLNRSQQFALRLGRHLGNFVEEQRATLGCPQEAQVVRIGTTERALPVSKQLALDQIFWNCGTVEGNEGCDRIFTALVNRVRY
jgi:hypothetical protein